MYHPKLSTKQKIYYYLKNHGEVSGTELERKAEEWTTKASVVARRARELAHDGTLDRRLSEKGTVYYRIKGTYSMDTLNAEQANELLNKLRQEELM